MSQDFHFLSSAVGGVMKKSEILSRQGYNFAICYVMSAHVSQVAASR